MKRYKVVNGVHETMKYTNMEIKNHFIITKYYIFIGNNVAHKTCSGKLIIILKVIYLV